MWTFTTDPGDLDCLIAPDGTGGYQDLVAGAPSVSFQGLAVRIAALDDLIRMKEASGQKARRVKDCDDVRVLHQFRRPAERGASPPRGGADTRVWVPDYQRADGTVVAGYWCLRSGRAQ